MKKILALMFLIFTITAFGDQVSEEVTVEGVGGIKGSNMGKARDEAIWDAQRKAVEKGVGVFLSAETVVSNARLIEDSIYTQANGFVEDYKILSETKDEFLYYVKIKAVVKTSDIGDKLILLGLIKKVGDPRIMVILDGDREAADIAENNIIKYLAEAGYRTVDKNQIAKIRESERMKRVAEGNDKEAALLAQQFGSDIIITGRADGGLESVNAYNVNTTSFKGAVSIKVLKVDNGEILLSMSRVATAPLAMNKIEAAERAFSKTIKEMAEGKGGDKKDAYIYAIAKSLLQKPSIQLLITGINSTQYDELVKFLKDERTIKKVFPRELSGTTARIDVDYDRTPEKLKELLESNKDLTIKTEGITRNKIDLKIIKPTVIEIKNIPSFSEFSEFINKLSAEKEIKVTGKKYSSNNGTINVVSSTDLMKILEKITDKYEIIDFSDEKVLLQRK